MRIIDLLHQNNRMSALAAVLVETGCEITYQVLWDFVRQLADKLRRQGCRPGVKVGLYLNNGLEYLVGYFAISEAHGAIVPLSRQMTSYELSIAIQSADISILITDSKGYSIVNEVDTCVAIMLLSIEGGLLLIETKRQGRLVADEMTSDVALMIATSGTTGAVKYVMLTDHQLLSNMVAYRNHMRFDMPHRVYCALPFCHIYSINAQILTHISLGDTLYISNGHIYIKDFFRAVQSYKISISAFVPYYAIMMANYPEKCNLPSLQVILLAGGKTPEHIISTLSKIYSHINFVNTYGLTEAGPRVAVAGSKCPDIPPASTGKTLKDITIKIYNENNTEVQDGSVGEIWVKSPSVMKGYYKQPQLTDEVLSNGWLKTGDLGRFDEQGNLYIMGRKKELIISGGKNIYPSEIEECLLKHPHVLEAAVVAKEHSTLQEVPYAFIVTRENKSIQLKELIEHCRGYLSNYKIPQYFHRIDALPKLNVSKNNKILLASYVK